MCLLKPSLFQIDILYLCRISYLTVLATATFRTCQEINYSLNLWGLAKVHLPSVVIGEQRQELICFQLVSGFHKS